MSLLPHQQRVVAEYEDLYKRTVALGQFLCTDTFRALDEAERGRLYHQWKLMNQLGLVLQERIEAFTPQDAGNA